MSMETTAWTQLHSVMNATQDRRPLARDTLRRVGAFARPHRRRITQFVLLSTVTAMLAVATPSSPDGSSTPSSPAGTPDGSPRSPC